MKYFEHLPKIDINNEEHRNIFRKVVVDYIKEQQLINYRLKDYETLPDLSYKLYASVDFWWVIALINDIYDINFDIPLPTEQIEYIAEELASHYHFENSLIQSAIITIDVETESITIPFLNVTESEYFVALLPFADEIGLQNIVEYGYEQINNESFKINFASPLLANIQMCYGVFKKPYMVKEIDSLEFNDYFTKLLREADTKRNIRFIKAQDLSTFLTKFLLELQGRGEKTDFNSTKILNHSSTTNFLKTYPDIFIPEHGLIVDIMNNKLYGSGYYSQLVIKNYDFDYQIFITPKPNETEIGNVGAIGVRAGLANPRVYNTGIGGCEYDYLIVSPDDKNYSREGEIVESGIGVFQGAGSSEIISIDDYPNILSAEAVGVMITPLVDNIDLFENVGVYGFKHIDKNNFEVFNLGESGNRFFWSVFETPVLPLTIIRLDGYSSFVDVENRSGGSIPDICILIACRYESALLSGSIGEIGIDVIDDIIIRVFNSGTAGNIITYKSFSDVQYGDVVSNGYTPIEIALNDDLNVTSSSKVFIAITPTVNNVDSLGNIGSVGVRAIDKNNAELVNTGDLGYGYRWFLITDYLSAGEAYFAGSNSYSTILIGSHTSIKSISDICLMITPITDDIDELGHVGEFIFEPITLEEVRVYNTGLAGNKYKWCLVEKDG